jgi:hypothetical protein
MAVDEGAVVYSVGMRVHFRVGRFAHALCDRFPSRRDTTLSQGINAYFLANLDCATDTKGRDTNHCDDRIGNDFCPDLSTGTRARRSSSATF